MLISFNDKIELLAHASLVLPGVKTDLKKNTLNLLAQALESRQEQIMKANEEDVQEKKGRIDKNKYLEIIKGIKELVELGEPTGQTLKTVELDEGFELYCMSCPIGIIGAVLDENLLALLEIIALCIKSSNALMVHLPESKTAEKIMELIGSVCGDLPDGWLQIIKKKELKKMFDAPLDLMIPIGSRQFVDDIRQSTKIPIIGHKGGVCHIYVDQDANVEMAVSICYDAKCQNPLAKNAMETLLVHTDIASAFLNKLKETMDVAPVKFVGDDNTLKILSIEHAREKDWETSYHGLALSIKIVTSIDEAIDHINRFGSSHTDAIVTSSDRKARKFLEKVDSANVFWNCSTRFSDGFRYGMGAEVTTSSYKIHARGPVGLEGLVTYKWKLLGKGNILADYSGKDPKKKFNHKSMSKDFPLKE
ncbi:glutamate-5-semialdehyde dehydrogenase [Candidatus Woesearchaeota archaeon]|nr:glutamate-5-semialdehyde dehydrogenase [Candidatus Woesearchaeota archaeon]